jgi:antitoxin component of MazEF toxin-antitoxin module
MSQLHDVAERYKEWKAHRAKVSRWGSSLGIRLPKELAAQYGIKEHDQLHFIPEKDGIKLVQ